MQGSRLAMAVVAGTILLSSCGGASDSIAPTGNDVTTSPMTVSEAPAAVSTAATSAETATKPCVDEANIRYICGVTNGEDILPLEGTPYVLASGMNGQLTGNAATNGKIHLINRNDKSFSILFPGEAPALALDSQRFPGCPGALDTSNFSAHGLGLQSTGENQYNLYMTSHGAREAIEVFTLDVSGEPQITWVGCVPMPVTSWTNSLAILKDGGFVATQFMDPTGSGMQGVTAKEITGHVFEWHPGQEVGVIAGTELSGPNGIVISPDERYLYVAAFGTAEIVRFDRGTTPVTKTAVTIGVAPDNIRWTRAGTLYTAGGNTTDTCGGPECGLGWSVWEIQPDAMQAARLTGVDEKAAMQGVSSASEIGNEIWIGTYGGDRLGVLTKPAQ